MGNICKWYDESSGMKRAYDKGLLNKKWIENLLLEWRSWLYKKKKI